MNHDQLAQLTSIHGLVDKLHRGVLGSDGARAAHRTVANLVLQQPTEDTAEIIYRYLALRETLAQLLASWQINKEVMQQGIRMASEAGCPAEADRLNERLSGIVLLWDQINRALANSQLSTLQEKRQS